MTLELELSPPLELDDNAAAAVELDDMPETAVLLLLLSALVELCELCELVEPFSLLLLLASTGPGASLCVAYRPARISR